MSVEPAPRARGFLAGVSFLTRVPVRVAIGERDIAASVAWFPVVGALVGAVSGAVYLGASQLWPPLVAALLAVGAGIAVTGAFHEDGLGDTADAFGAASTGRDPQPVLKDPRMGTFGVVALVLVIGLRVASVASLTPRGRRPRAHRRARVGARRERRHRRERAERRTGSRVELRGARSPLARRASRSSSRA